MGRWLLTATMLAILGMGSTFYLSLPDAGVTVGVRDQLRKIGSRIAGLFESHSESKYLAAKDQAWAEWQAKFPVAQDCINPQTEAKTSECRKSAELSEDQFEKQWHQSIASGWLPSHSPQSAPVAAPDSAVAAAH